MKVAYKFLAGLLLGIFLTSGVWVFMAYRSPAQANSQDYTLPKDNFDQQTMNTINAHLEQYHVSGTPMDHEVYMVTGGLEIANPRIMYWDSGGGMNFGGNQGTDPIYNIQFISQSPANWKTDNGKPGEWQAVPWVLKHTKSGDVYYEWDEPKYQTTQFYFKKRSTYVLLRMDYWVNSPKPTFPQGLLSHLVPVGNPVTAPKK